ncbi:MAG: benzaldehyde dehydrogenase [Candidatus Limnocylindrales bacterium]
MLSEKTETTKLLDPATWAGRIFSGGEWASGSSEYDVMEPATGQAIGRLGAASGADVRKAAKSAAKAQRSWAAMPYEERAGIMRKAGDLWRQHADEVRGWIVRESGSIPPKADIEINFAASACYEAAALPSMAYGQVLRTPQAQLSMTRRLPVGVVGVISPFNFPLILSIRAVAPALALGNSVVLKPDPRTAVCGGVTLARVFQEAGLPAGVFSVLPGGADTGAALVEDPAISMISFTGSTRGGRLVAEMAGRSLKRTHLELGGNSALVILDDVDLEKAASIAAFGAFNHQGQICMATDRVLIAERVADEFVERLAAHASHLPVGNPATGQVALGPVIDAGQRDRIHRIVTTTVDKGARLVTGGTFEELFYKPTVLANVASTAPAFVEEIFGPVAPVTTFRTLDEAADLANSTEYGLSLGILTTDVMRGLALADRIDSGIVHINDQTVMDEVVNPFGGVKSSGPGARIGGAESNIDAFTNLQWVTIRGDLPQYPF